MLVKHYAPGGNSPKKLILHEGQSQGLKVIELRVI